MGKPTLQETVGSAFHSLKEIGEQVQRALSGFGKMPFSFCRCSFMLSVVVENVNYEQKFLLK